MALSNTLIRALMTEFIGTLFIVFASCWSFKSYELSKISIAGLASVNALVLAFTMWAGYSTSGAHYNPVITFEYVFIKKKPITTALYYIATQVSASILAGFVVLVMTPLEYQQSEISPAISFPRILPIITEFQGFIIEFVLSFAYTLIYFSCIANQKQAKNYFGIALGSIMFIGTVAAGPYTGSCINIMRIFGPSIFTGYFASNWIYLIANIFGGLFGGFYYDKFIDYQSYIDAEQSQAAKSMKTPENYNQALNLQF